MYFGRCWYQWISKSYSFNQFKCNPATWNILHWHDSLLGHYKPWLFFIQYLTALFFFLYFSSQFAHVQHSIFRNRVRGSESIDANIPKHRIPLSNHFTELKVMNLPNGSTPFLAIYSGYSVWAFPGQSYTYSMRNKRTTLHVSTIKILMFDVNVFYVFSECVFPRRRTMLCVNSVSLQFRSIFRSSWRNQNS